LRFLSASFVFAALALALSSPAVADWFPATQMSTARWAATATLLNDGRVLVVGGQDASTAFLASAELYDPETNTWSPAASLAAARSGHTATLLNDGRVFVFGGATGTSPTPEIYEPATNSWSPASMTGGPSTRIMEHTATRLQDGRVLVAGGLSSGGACCITGTFVYDPGTDTWSSGGSFANAGGRARHAAALLPNGKVLVVGGWRLPSTVETTAIAEIWDPATSSWSTGAPMARTRADHTATLLGNSKVLVVGGFTGSGSPRAELYDLGSGMWSNVTAPSGTPQPTVDHTATLLETGDVLIAGGRVAADIRSKLAVLYEPDSNTWKVEPNLGAVRDRHTGTLLRDGRLLIAGGLTEGGFALETAELYEPRRRLWNAAAPMGVARHAHAATELEDGSVLVAGGFDNSLGVPVASAELYDAGGDSWSPTDPMGTARYQAAVVRLGDGRVLVAGGDSASDGPHMSAELYDPDPDAWEPTAETMDDKRAALTLTLLDDGKVLAAGGYESASLETGVVAVNTAEIYDPVLDTWTPTGDVMAVPRYGHTATRLADGKVLVTGGSNAIGSSLSSAEVFDPLTGEWTTVASMTGVRLGHTATLLPNGKVLVVGGFVRVANQTLASAEIYDPDTNTWTSAAALRTARTSHTATLLANGTVLVAGGGFWSTELYDPIFDEWFPGPSFRSTRGASTVTLLGDGRLLATGGENTDEGGSRASAEIVAPPNVVLAPVNVGSPDPVVVGGEVTYQLALENEGSELATAVRLRDELPERAVLMSVTPSQGRCAGSGPILCALGNLAGGATATVEVVVATRIAGTALNTVRVRHDEGGAGFDASVPENTTVTPDANGCTIVGTADPETVDGTAAADIVCGYGDNDTVNGLAGDDTLAGGLGNDMLVGGEGNDSASYRAASGGVTAELSSGATGADGNDTFAGIENLLGSSARDVLAGDGGANVLDGGGGDDELTGAAGNDTLIGGLGTDTFNGGAGADTIRSRDGVAEIVVCDAQDTVEADPSDTLAGCSAAPPPPPPPPPPAAVADTTAPALTLVIKARQKLLPALRKGLRATAGCSEACAMQAKLLITKKLAKRLKLPTVVGKATKNLTAAGTTNLVVKFTAKAKRKLAKLRSVRLTLELVAADAAGNAAKARKAVTLRRR
jgi:uncharacterized repeat protein (TIGR01451 family)